jgi:putative ABC transport system permease protein
VRGALDLHRAHHRLQERARDLALLRTLGAPPAKLLALIAAEGMTLVGAGAILGLALGHAAAEAIGRWLAHSQSWSVTGFAWEPAEAILLVLIMASVPRPARFPRLQATSAIRPR